MECTIKDIQSKQYEMLVELDRICKKYDIKYYLAQGTLLGAARSNKFIPWDDDIDIIISHDELERLMEVFQKETKYDYLLTNHKVEKHYPYTWSKIRAGHTLSRPVAYKSIPIHWGICMDLFPIYPISNIKLFRAIEIFIFKVSRKMLLTEMTKYDKNKSFSTRILEIIPIPTRHFMFNLSLRIFKAHKNDTKYVFVTAKGGWIMNRDTIFGDNKSLLFEDVVFPVPADYDKFLRLQFGDYMTPPPLSERKGHELNMGEIEWSINYDGDYHS